MPSRHLATYLQDHLAGSVVALETLAHLEQTHAGTDLATFFAHLRADVTADQDELKTLMTRLVVSTGTVRAAVAWVAEKAARLKLRLDDTADGPLRLLEAVELVATGIDGKRGLWLALEAAAEDVADLRGPEYEQLADRAVEQRERIEPVRLAAAKAALR